MQITDRDRDLFPIADIIDRTPLLVSGDTPVLEAIESIGGYGNCILVGERDRVVGIVTPGDILRWVSLGTDLSTLRVDSVMTSPLITATLTPDLTVTHAIGLLSEHQIGHLPILDPEGKLVGIVTHTALLKILFQQNCRLEKANQELEQKLMGCQTTAAQPLLELTEDLRQSEQKFRAIFNNTFQFVALLTTEGIAIEANQTSLEGIACDRSAVIGRAFWETPWWADFPEQQDRLRQGIVSAARGEFVRFESKHRWADGSLAFVDFSLKPIFDEQGDVVMLLAEGRDITERKQAEEHLKRSSLALSHAVEGISQLDAQGHYRMVNQAYANMVGYQPSEMLGMSWLPTVHPDDIERLLAAYDWMLQTGKVEVEARGIRQDGSCFDKQLTMVADYDLDQKFNGHYCFMKDITSRKVAEAELERQKQDLTRSNEELQQFAYVASHDLQEPLRMITSYLELLERRYQGRLDERADKFIAYAVDGAGRMQMLIQDLLSYSRVGTRSQPFKMVDCAAIVGDTLINLRIAIAESDAVITTDPLPLVMGDGIQLTQVFQNLIGNAIKFRRAEPPQIHISVRETDGNWLFCVQDNGIGIDLKYIDRIFIIFQRLHSRTDYGGTGIGLAVCKKIIERHGGRIWVESDLDQGSRFYFTLPARSGVAR
jgi:PAS domain S-box-containing protein